MTTVAWDGLTLAADKQVTMGGLPYTLTKIFKVKDSLLCFCGNMSQVSALVHWFEYQGGDPELYPEYDKNDTTTMIEINKYGEIFDYGSTGHPFEIEDNRFAIGSGRDFALAAMECGKTAHEAVVIAMKFDVYTGRGITTLQLDEAPWEKKCAI